MIIEKSLSKKIGIAIQMAILLLLFTACSSSKEEAMESIKFPEEPPEEALYDTSNIHATSQWGKMNTHDPSIFKDGDTYYTVSTDIKVGGQPAPAIQIRKSDDLITWEYVGTALESVPEDAYEWTNANILWAPDLVKMNGKYHLYYSASTFGSNQSMIGLLTSDSMEGPWKNQGAVIKSSAGGENNAIDPTIINDRDGNPWMVYGSFFGGIYIKQLDAATGMPLDEGVGTLIARRSNDVANAVEGPYITYNEEEDKFYLFVSYDSLSADYNVRVARSENIDGPYVDYTGNEMTDTQTFPFEVGTKLMGGYQFGDEDGWVAPGHNSILNDNGDYYMIHHARGQQDKNWSYLHVRKIVWTEDGWPLLSPERYAGEQEQPIPEEVLPGEWQYIYMSKYFNDVIPSEEFTLTKNGKTEEGSPIKSWEHSGENHLTLVYDDKNGSATITGKLIPAWDWEKWQKTIVFTGIDETGTTFWAKKVIENEEN